MVTTYYNGVYSAYNIKPYVPQLNKKVEKPAEEPEKSKNSEQTDADEKGSSSGYAYKSTINYKNNKVNISNILTDFNNTLKAIGAPENVEEEVKGYLSLVDIQSQKENPSPEIIKSNLKNAASILDGYITQALQKPSKVVSNWIDAILLQQVDYKAAPKATEETAEAPSSSNNIFEQTSNESKPVTPEKVEPEKPSPETLKLNSLYKKSTNLLDSGDHDKALKGLNKTIEMAQKLDNKTVQSKAYMDVAFIHDTNNDLNGALENYNNALVLAKEAGDMETVAKAHYNMGTIYDDVGHVDTALGHYFSALGLDGETENLEGQSMTLNSIGNMYVVKNDYKTGLSYYKIAFGLAKEQDNKTAMASITSNVAGAFRDLGYDQKALKYYGDAVKYDMQAGNVAGYAKSYDLAGDIFFKKNKTDKAQNLYKKSLNAAQKIGDRTWASMMQEKIEKTL